MANEIGRSLQDAFLDWGGFEYRGSCAVGDWDTDDVDGALRFVDIQIPQGTTVVMAYIVYVYGGTGEGTGRWKVRVRGIDEDNTASFSSNPIGRSKTDAEVLIDDGGPPTEGGSKKINVRDIVQEIVNRGGWSSGNAMGFVLQDNGSGDDVYAFAANADTYLVYRLSAEPNFKPTPISVSAPSVPAVQDYGFKISRPGQSVLTATEDELFYTSRKKQFKVLLEDEVISEESSYDPIVIPHNLGYIPFLMLYQKEIFTDNWIKLPSANYFDYEYAFFYADETNLYIYPTGQGEHYYYRIFLDQLV